MSASDLRPARRAAVLAGGAGSRMGGPKAGVELAGRPLAAFPLAAAESAGLHPFVVAKADTPLPDLGCPVVEEPAEPRHPLVGVIAALEHAGEPLVVIACDLPLLPPRLLAALAATRSPFAMPDHPRPQPLVARWSPGLLPRLGEAVRGGESMTAVAAALGGKRIGAVELARWGEPATIFANVNSVDDLARAAAQLSGSSSTRAL